MGTPLLQLNKNFAKYCREGKMNLVQKWIDDNRINIDWKFSEPTRGAVQNNHMDILKLLLSKHFINVKYEEFNGEKWDSNNINGVDINMICNPFTDAMIEFKYDMMDQFLKHKDFNVFRKEYLNIILELDNTELTNYFLKINGFIEFIGKQEDEGYTDIISQEVIDIFLF